MVKYSQVVKYFVETKSIKFGGDETYLSNLYLFGVDLKSALGKKRRDGRSALPQPLTTIQRVHISRLVDKYGDDYQVGIRLLLFVIKIQEFANFDAAALHFVVVVVVVLLAEYADGYKAKSHAAFNWNSTEIVHEVSHAQKQESAHFDQMNCWCYEG